MVYFQVKLLMTPHQHLRSYYFPPSTAYLCSDYLVNVSQPRFCQTLSDLGIAS